MKTRPLDACLMGLGLLLVGAPSFAGEADKGVPKVVEKLSVYGAKVKPCEIGRRELKAFVAVARTEDFDRILQAGQRLFRIYAGLPADFARTFSGYQPYRASTSDNYTFYKSGLKKLILYVAPESRLVLAFQVSDNDGIRSPLEAPREEEMPGLFRNYLEAEGWKLEHHRISFDLFGQKTWFARVYPKQYPPSGPPPETVFVLHSAGRFHKATLGFLVWAVNRKFPESTKRKSPLTAIRSIIKLDGGGEIISGTKDIPGYEESRLDPDLEPAVRAPYHFRNRYGSRTYVAFAYRRPNGIVRRYRFDRDKNGNFQNAECLLFGRGIGAAIYYQ